MKSDIINKMQCYWKTFQGQLSFNQAIKTEFPEKGVPLKHRQERDRDKDKEREQTILCD